MFKNVTPFKMVNIYYIRREESKGLRHVIHCAKSFIENVQFTVILGDNMVAAKTPYLKQIIKTYEE